MKKTVSLILTISLVILSVFCVPMTASAAVYEPDREIYAGAYMLLSLDDKDSPIVAEKNQDEKMYPASLTKIVTAIVTLNNVDDLSKTTKVSQNAYDVLLGTGAQTAGLKVGEELTIEQLLYLTMVHSACDACEVLAEYVGGSIDGFVTMMNEWTSSIGCENTNFVNPDGLHDDNHYTTASDMAKITLEALKNSTFKTMSETTSYKYGNTTFHHTNLMLQPGYVSYYYEYAKGIKTGSTEEAGYCVITEASKDGYNYLAIVLGSPRIDYNKDGIIEKCSFIDAGSLFDWAFTSLKYATLITKDEMVTEINVENGKDADSVSLIAKEDVNTIVPSSLDKSAIIVKPVDMPESISAPIKKGDKVCTADIIYGDQTVATVELVAGSDVELSTFLKIFNAIKNFFSLMIVKIILLLVVLFIVLYVYLLISNAKKKKRRRLEKQRQYEDDNCDDDYLPPPRKR